MTLARKLSARWYVWTVAGLVGSIIGSGAAVQAAEKEKTPSVEQVAADTAAAIKRGVDFLVATQNKRGSWGDQSIRGGVPIYSSIPGGFDGFQLGTSSLCMMALVETGDTRPEVVQAIERGEAFLLEHLPRLRRSTPDLLVNVWGHCYGIRALVRLHNRLEKDDPRRAKIIKAIEQQVDLLDRFSAVNGGWTYYDFGRGAIGFSTKHPNGDPTSFTTASVLIALHEAQELGVELPKVSVNKAVTCLTRQCLPDFAYSYSLNHALRAPMGPINRLPGSLGRSHGCNLALKLHGVKKVTDKVLETWLDHLFKHNFWLTVGRKTIRPHESHAQVAGYFFYYGHFYAAGCIEALPKEKRPKYALQMAPLICSLQEKHDGSWFDYPLYNYHKPYGTAYALMTLVRCQRNLPSAGTDAVVETTAAK